MLFWGLRFSVFFLSLSFLSQARNGQLTEFGYNSVDHQRRVRVRRLTLTSKNEDRRNKQNPHKRRDGFSLTDRPAV
ncbi:hypothetical protein BKA91DRAFT_131713 [Yarrowia lipolytica]|nr:hypothetical protein BKA91DRAFT_131713 [Yarrowia lipolytica]KAE8173590.1 hypothetical protein BKA90DRAFT_135620 [Yarrowia lipolytica]RMJ00307.1 hypothetical protein BD777DRAFT_123090 [Yarrowia lipolytica]